MAGRIIILLAALFSSGIANAVEEYRVGMSAAFTGPLEFVGNSMRDGIEAYFSYINSEGGIHGKEIHLIARDDGYEPTRSAKNVRYLIDQEDVIAIIGNVGTPTAALSAPIASRKKTLFFGAFTGAELLRMNPPDRYIINYRASYQNETETIINCILDLGIKPEEIAFFTQKDTFGDAGYRGAVNALERRGYKNTGQLAHGRYERNTMNVEFALSEILNARIKPKAVVMAGTYEPSAKFIQLAKKELPDLFFFNLSFVGGYALKNQLQGNTENIVITQVVPDFTGTTDIAREYLANMWNYKNNRRLNYISFEGYIVAKIFVEALKRAQGEVDKEKLVDAFYKLENLDIGMDEKITFSKTRNQAIIKVWPVTIRNGIFENFEISKINSDYFR